MAKEPGGLGGSSPLKIDHIHYAYSHSLLQSRLAMTIYIAIKAQWLTIKIAPLQQEDQHDLLNMNINESWILMNHWRELLSVCPLSGTNFTPLWWDGLRCDYNLLYCVLPIYACVAPGSNGDRLQCGTMAVACLLCPTLNFIKLDLLLLLFFLPIYLFFCLFIYFSLFSYYY